MPSIDLANDAEILMVPAAIHVEDRDVPEFSFSCSVHYTEALPKIGALYSSGRK